MAKTLVRCALKTNTRNGSTIPMSTITFYALKVHDLNQSFFMSHLISNCYDVVVNQSNNSCTVKYTYKELIGTMTIYSL